MKEEITMNKISAFSEQEVLGQQFSIYGDAEYPLFLAKDVAEWIDHKDVSTMIRNIDNDEKGTNIVCTLGGNQEMWLLTEDGLYEILMQSRKPIAKTLKKEIKQILKQIRITGGYIPLSTEDNDKIINEKVHALAQKTIEHYLELEKTLHEKAAYADRMLKEGGNLTATDFAKSLCIEGFKINGSELLKWMRAKEYLNEKNNPYQQYINKGYLLLRTFSTTSDSGNNIVTYTPLFTPKGQQYFFQKLQEDVEKGTLAV